MSCLSKLRAICLSPNPPKAMDEDSGIYGGDGLGSIGVDGRSGDSHRAPMAVCGRWAGRRGEDAARNHPGPGFCGDLRLAGDAGRRQAGNGMACSRARARLPKASAGGDARRAERVSPPGEGEEACRRVLVVTICSPRPSRAVQRARLWAITCTARRRGAARGEMIQPYAVLEVSDGVLAGVAAVVGLQFQRLPFPVGDEGVICIWPGSRAWASPGDEPGAASGSGRKGV